jgi:hypothetical protein
LSRSGGKEEKTTSKHTHILHEHNHLDPIAEISVKDERGWNEKNKNK